jgi:hypothetical protein
MVPIHDAGLEGKDVGHLYSLLPRHEPLFVCLGANLKDRENKPLPANLKDLRDRITREFSKLLEAMGPRLSSE